MGYKKSSDYIFWLIQRLTGILLFIYMFMHSIFTFILKNDTTFFYANLVKSIFIIKFLEFVLILIVFAHTLIGIRVLLLETEFASTKQKLLNKTIAFIFIILALIFFVKFFLIKDVTHV